MATLCLFLEVDAQNQTSLLKPLKIGDTIPEAIWNLPLQVVNHPNAKQMITLNDYRGKLIILDFWATWCSSCIEAMPKMMHLQEGFGNQIQIFPITFQSKSIVHTFLQKNATGKSLKLPIINGDTILSKVFPHKLISHLVWIDPSGILKATTWSENAKKENIQSVLNNESLSWTMKKDMGSFDKNVSLLSFSDNGAPLPKTVFYSAFTSHLNGVNPTAGIFTDSLKGATRYYNINATATSLCVIAWGKPIPELSPKQYIFLNSASKYKRTDRIYREDWNRLYTYCYDAVMPIHYTEGQFAALLKEDLKRIIKLEGSLEKTNVKCIIVKSIEDGKIKRAKSSKSILLSDFIWFINNKIGSFPYAINETGNQNLRTDLIRKNYKDFQNLAVELAKDGLKATLEDREIETFIIKEIN
ncbi:AhpC/TSA family protein [Pedobacter cryoconitis]|uniref:AhpC/TSA family protein n=2 Tax=Pedobacter cryoconitis TaxID=188932 RepID=A0A327SS43_9SPHI|nr:AhpC/TSA family protein [Pedobacter cryoconitis]